tara:strand:+ start:1015 stop:2667 length:1653 start_codon:yes stop_codon:yes gene_type:complete
MSSFNSGYKTQIDMTFYGQGLDYFQPSARTVTNAGIEQGWRYTGFNSIQRGQEANLLEGIRKYQQFMSTGKMPTAFEKMNMIDPAGPVAEHLKKKYDVPELTLQSPEYLQEKYGDTGLKFDSEMLELEAEILYQRKRNEIRNNYIMSQAKGGRFAKGLLINMGMAILDPLNIGLVLIPGALPTKIGANLGWQSKALLRGGTAGFVGTAALEPIIYGQAKSEQADYTMADSMINLAFGTIAGGGLHLAGSGIGHIHAKRLAAKQLQADENVTIDNIKSGVEEVEAEIEVDKLKGADTDKINEKVVALKKELKKIRTRITKAENKKIIIEGEETTLGELSDEELKILGTENKELAALQLIKDRASVKDAEAQLNTTEAELKTAEEFKNENPDNLDRAEIELDELQKRLKAAIKAGDKDLEEKTIEMISKQQKLVDNIKKQGANNKRENLNVKNPKDYIDDINAQGSKDNTNSTSNVDDAELDSDYKPETREEEIEALEELLLARIDGIGDEAEAKKFREQIKDIKNDQLTDKNLEDLETEINKYMECKNFNG